MHPVLRRAEHQMRKRRWGEYVQEAEETSGPAKTKLNDADPDKPDTSAQLHVVVCETHHPTYRTTARSQFCLRVY